jgi:hypothetical protein
MKRILFAVLALAVCVGCSGSKTSNSTPITPTPVPTSISILPPTATIDVQGTQQFNATVKDQNGVVMNTPVTWASNPTSYASITQSGLATGLIPGETNITASVGTLTMGALVYIIEPNEPVPTISVNPNSGSTAGGTSITITGTNFTQGATVTIGEGLATSTVVVNSTTITAITPANPAGQVALTLTTNGQTLNSSFTYITPIIQKVDIRPSGFPNSPPTPTLYTDVPTAGYPDDYMCTVNTVNQTPVGGSPICTIYFKTYGYDQFGNAWPNSNPLDDNGYSVAYKLDPACDTSIAGFYQGGVPSDQGFNPLGVWSENTLTGTVCVTYEFISQQPGDQALLCYINSLNQPCPLIHEPMIYITPAVIQ